VSHSHPQFPKVEGIPQPHLHGVCLLHQVGACFHLDFNPYEGKRVCSKWGGRHLPHGVSNTGEQYKVCSGAPEYRSLLPAVPELAPAP